MFSSNVNLRCVIIRALRMSLIWGAGLQFYVSIFLSNLVFARITWRKEISRLNFNYTFLLLNAGLLTQIWNACIWESNIYFLRHNNLLITNWFTDIIFLFFFANSKRTILSPFHHEDIGIYAVWNVANVVNREFTRKFIGISTFTIVWQ